MSKGWSSKTKRRARHLRIRVPAILGMVLAAFLILQGGCGAAYQADRPVDTGEEPPPPPPPPPTEPPPDEVPPDTAQAGYERFPFPVPQVSALEEIPRNWVARGGSPLLSDVNSTILDALNEKGYYDTSYYAVPGGFALATRMEETEADGRSKQGPQRWSLAPEHLQKFDLSDYLSALFHAKPGYYRVIVFVVTSVPISQTSTPPSAEEAEMWLTRGHDRLPPGIGREAFSPEHQCTALIYEFERPSEDDVYQIKRPGRLAGRDHLVKAGLWEALAR